MIHNVSTKQMTALLLALLLLTSCGSTTEETTNAAKTTDPTAQTETVETEKRPALPEDLTFDGRTFNLLTSYYNDYCKITKEEANGEVLNDAIYTMEINTEDRLDVEIVEDQQQYNAAITMANAMVAAGDNTYAAMNQLDRFAIDMMVQGSLRPLEDAAYLGSVCVLVASGGDGGNVFGRGYILCHLCLQYFDVCGYGCNICQYQLSHRCGHFHGSAVRCRTRGDLDTGYAAGKGGTGEGGSQRRRRIHPGRPVGTDLL